MMQQCVDQGSGPVPRRRMYDKAGRLVQHQDALILVHNVQRDGLGLQLQGLRPGNVQRNAVAAGLIFRMFPP